jgi:DNA-binding MurR/RpiR family transcriptional regulator
MDRLEAVRRHETVLVVSPGRAPGDLLERVNDARRHGANVLAMESGAAELRSIAHETLTVPALGSDTGEAPPISLEIVQHLVSVAAGEYSGGRRGFRDRLGRLLDVLNGPQRNDLRNE